MQIIQKIAAWAAEQSAWVDDAVRRIIAGELKPEDLRELADLAKAEHGFPAPDGKVAKRLDPKLLPTGGKVGMDVSLLALRSPQNLNAIDNEQALTFQPAGLTIIYGHNGAGKSGYARALKKACRARNVEDVLPDVYSQDKGPAIASAVLDWRVGDQAQSQKWVIGTVPPAPLSQISVFDAHCARVFVDYQAKVLFVPDGLEIAHRLSEVLGEVQRLIEGDKRADSFDRNQLAPLAGTSIVGQAYAKLGRASLPEDFIKLSELSEEESTERVTLSKLLGDEDPLKLATNIRRNVIRLSTLCDEIATLEAPLLDASTGQLANAFAAMVGAEAASKLAADALQAEGDKVLGTGTQPWETLLRSAIEYATEVAYPGHPFPGPDEGANCVLCQQPLTGEATDRLKSFFQFLEADAQKKFYEARDITKRLYRPISSLRFEGFPTDRAFLDELQESHPALVLAIREYVAALTARQASVVAMAPTRKIDVLPPLPESPIVALKALIGRQTDEAARLSKALTKEEREQKSKLLADFNARLKLAELLPVVLKEIEWLKRDHQYGEAIKGCSTRNVTAKATELYEAHVTEELRTAFTHELTNLGLGKLQVVLEMTGQKGARMQQLKLPTAPRYAKARASDVLSEGEQRVIAMALFLAEVGIEPGASGFIFDDPVSSLDHVRRERIAKRLVLEAKKRQIIVFTHDLAFAWALKDFAGDNGVAHADRHIFSAGAKKGICAEGLPFEGKKLAARIQDLRELAYRAKKILEEDRNHDLYNDVVRNGYRRMRDTWELLIEEHLLAGTVKRFRRSVETSKLRYVSVNDAEASAVFNGMTKCSNFTHEGGAEAPPPLPEPAEFLSDVEELAAALKLIDENKKLTEKRRAAAGLAVSS